MKCTILLLVLAVIVFIGGCSCPCEQAMQQTEQNVANPQG